MTAVFLHGLDSSSQGTKAKWFRKNFPEMVIPDFTGTIDDRMEKLITLLGEEKELVLIGSSFGGLMATLFARENESRIHKIILLAPALNFPDFVWHKGRKVNVSAKLFIGSQDTVCPPNIVVPVAQKVYANLSVNLSDDDHLLRDTFTKIDWKELLNR